MEDIIKAYEVSYKGILKKNYSRAKRSAEPLKVLRNQFVESAYFRILETAKRLYRSQKDKSKSEIYERNRKGDKSCLEAIHDFVSPNFLFNLYCDFSCECWIDYTFQDCSFEHEIMRLVQECGLSECMKRIEKDDYPSYYNNMLALNRNFITTL